MALSKQNVELLPLTPEAVETFKQIKPLPGERELRAARLKTLLGLVRAGLFEGVDWAQGRCAEDGVLYRFDGQHTAKLLADLAANPDPVAPFPTGKSITLVTWAFDSVADDSPQIFEMFNHPMSVRTSIDAMHRYRAMYSDLSTIDAAFLVKVMNGILFWNKRRRTDKAPLLHSSPRQIGMHYNDEINRHFAVWAAQFRERRLGKFLNRTGVMARLYADWLDDSSTAALFWALVLDESAPDPEDETRVFAETLKRLNSAKNKVTQDRFFEEGARAWKRYRQQTVSTRSAA